MTLAGRAAAEAARLRPGPALIAALAAAITIEAFVGVVAVVARISTTSSATATFEAIPGPARALTRPIGAPSPIEVTIPSIGVRSGLVGLGLNSDGSLETPNEYDSAGWWAWGSAPGVDGPAVLVGHRDSRTGPAVFHRLGRVEPGDEVSVRRSDGSQVRFLVDERLQVGKGEFPTERVYGPTQSPTLRLITCGGRFDRRQGSYDDNVVVFARLAPQPALSE